VRVVYGINVDTDVSTYKNASHFPLEGFAWLVRVDCGIMNNQN